MTTMLSRHTLIGSNTNVHNKVTNEDDLIAIREKYLKLIQQIQINEQTYMAKLSCLTRRIADLTDDEQSNNLLDNIEKCYCLSLNTDPGASALSQMQRKYSMLCKSVETNKLLHQTNIQKLYGKLGKLINMQFTCNICTDAVPRKRFISCGCLHKYCAGCLAKHITTLIAAGQFDNIGCPAQGCDTMASQIIIKRLVDTDSYDRYEYLTLKHAAGNMPDVCYCPNEQCNWIVEMNNTVGANCGKCKLEFCTKCRKHYHGACDYDEQRERMYCEQEEQANAMIASTTKSCPGCGSPIEKNDGCDHMTCTVCGNEFCWLCKAGWANHWRCAR